VDDQGFYQFLDQESISDDIHLFNEKLREWRTTTITIARPERWAAKLHTSDYSAKRELKCYRSLKTLHRLQRVVRRAPISVPFSCRSKNIDQRFCLAATL
jgi:hypothetical protein